MDTFFYILLSLYGGIVVGKHSVEGTGIQNACEFTIQDCNYTMSVLPSTCNEGQGSEVKVTRSKRTVTEENIDLSNIHRSINSLSNKYEKLEDKLIREMRQLSKRVLRGARKMESTLDDLADGGKGHTRSRSRCPHGFITVDDWPSCYMFSRFNTTWYEANDLCTALESDLVSLEEVNEHFVVTFLIRNNPDLQVAEGWWTSGSYINKSKQWVWKSQGEARPFSYIKWAGNEPNEGHDQNLLGMMMLAVDRLMWHDQSYTDKYNFVCEKLLD